VNWQHLQAFTWLRWRLLVNGWRRAGAFNAVLMMIVTLGALATAGPLLIGTFVLGLYLIPLAAPEHLLFAWDGLIVAFLFFWAVGLVTDLQRTEPLSLAKFMHLPVSVTGAFLINYVSSLLRLSMIIFAPAMLGFALALVVVKGILLLPVLPALAAFLLMITALTYQVQGWLAALMSNPRRRRAVIVATTMIFVLIVQLPNLLNFFAFSGAPRRADPTAELMEELTKLDREAQGRQFDVTELARRRRELAPKIQLARQQADQAVMKRVERTARLVNIILPVGWLPLGVMFAADGRVMPSILGIMGMGLIGIGSLGRAYATTVGLYQGRFTSRGGAPAAVGATPPGARKLRFLLVEARLPGFSEPVSAIALGGLRSLVRSPEAKMMLLTPVIMIPIFGSMLLRGGQRIPEWVRPLVAMAGMGLVLLGVLQMMANQFGFDRDGFRVFVLCAAPRRDILLGKNLVFAPLALGMGGILLAIIQAVCPMRLDHFLAMVPLYLSMFLVFCIVANLTSIYAPGYVASGSLKPSNQKLGAVFLQLVMFGFLLPLSQAAMLLPLGIEAVMRLLGWAVGVPIYLVLTLAELAVVVAIYHFSLNWQGGLLQAREQKILDVVARGAA
jgi:hypothetical protein